MPNISDTKQTPEVLELREFGNIPWQKKISRLEKILYFFIASSLLMIVVMLATLAVFTHLYKSTADTLDEISECNESGTNLCLTPECIHAASGILLSLDENVDPCQDFFHFACGGWLDQHTIPKDKYDISFMSEMTEQLTQKLRILLEKELDGTEPSYIKMAKDFYDSCVDLASIEKAGAEPLKKVLKNLGGWPVVEGSNWDDSNFDWISTLIAFKNSGHSHDILLRLAVSSDMVDNTINIIELDQPLLGMPERSYFIQGLNNPTTAAYYKLMVKSAKLLGANEVTAEKELLKALHFEIALANYSLSTEERQNILKLVKRYTVSQLQEEIPQISWLKYFNGLIKTEIFENDTVLTGVSDFIKKFADLITKTEKRVIANYMLWRLIFESLPQLSKEFVGIKHEYASAFGAGQPPPRWEQCVSSVNDMMGIALSAYYVRHYFNENSKDAANELIEYVYDEFLRILNENDWMDEETKGHAIEKAHAVNTYIGYPKELLNNTAVAKLYEDLSISNKSYYENIGSLNKMLADRGLSGLRERNTKYEWTKRAKVTVVNAYYKPDENIIEFPAGILQDSFFSKDLPYYLNFGKLGIVFGHEITHGFDVQGRKFDKDGNVVNWWAEETDKLFTEKAQCMIEQYNNYTAENGMRLNGLITLGENIADNGGYKEAYWAYHSWVKDKGQEKLLPGLSYNQNQLFWISAANWWCGKIRPSTIQLLILMDTHSISKFRVIGGMSNLEEFSKDFNCSPDSPMNRRQKCKVW